MSDTSRMKAAQLTAMEHMTGDVWRVGCDLERELAAANERIKQLEDQIIKAQKQKEIAAKLIDQIFREGPKNHAAEVLLNQYFWELV